MNKKEFNLASISTSGLRADDVGIELGGEVSTSSTITSISVSVTVSDFGVLVRNDVRNCEVANRINSFSLVHDGRSIVARNGSQGHVPLGDRGTSGNTSSNVDGSTVDVSGKVIVAISIASKASSIDS